MKLKDVLWKTGVHMTLGETDSRHRIELMLSNTTRDKYLIHLPGAVLEPDDPSHQRLFVAGVHGAAPQLWLRSGAQRRVSLATVCMDEQLKDPQLGLGFQVSHQEGPRHLLKAALRWQDQRAGCADDREFIMAAPEWDLSHVQLAAHGKI